jgi:Delta7-sterol 5-desaturase
MEELLHRWQFVYANIATRYFLMAGIAFLLFYVIFKKQMVGRKIQVKFPSLTDYGRDIFYSAISVAIFSVVSVLTFFVIQPYTNLYKNISDYGMPYYALTFVWMFFLLAHRGSQRFHRVR